MRIPPTQRELSRGAFMPVSARPVGNRTFASPALLLAATLLLAGGCKSSAPTESVNPQNVPAASPRAQQINGQDVVTLQRKATQNGSAPEFLSATVIPGRGMNLFQITANVPGKGTTNVFFAPSIDEAKGKLSGSDADKFGNASFGFGGAFLVPYPNRIRGIIDDKGDIITSW